MITLKVTRSSSSFEESSIPDCSGEETIILSTTQVKSILRILRFLDEEDRNLAFESSNEATSTAPVIQTENVAYGPQDVDWR